MGEPHGERAGRSVVTLVTRGGARAVEVERGASLLRAAALGGVPVGSSCRGVGVCGWCRVEVVDGAAGLAPPSAEELRLLQRLSASPKERIGCLAEVTGEPVAITTRYW